MLKKTVLQESTLNSFWVIFKQIIYFWMQKGRLESIGVVRFRISGRVREIENVKENEIMFFVAHSRGRGPGSAPPSFWGFKGAVAPLRVD